MTSLILSIIGELLRGIVILFLINEVSKNSREIDKLKNK